MIRVATIVKDEADRYFEAALKAWRSFADDIIVFDDDSTDDTVAVAERYDADVFKLIDGRDMWGYEAPHRAALFNYAMSKADDGDIIFWLDADMVPADDPSKFFDVENINAWAFYLYDLWGQDEDATLLYRSDEYWQAHLNPRVWAVRKPAGLDLTTIEWPQRGIHSGHIPPSWFQRDTIAPLVMPRDLSLLHYGYFSQRDRDDRHERYLSVKHQLTPHELAHAKTILSPAPTRRLPFTPKLVLT